MSAETFRIVYDGPALEGHTMDVRELAPALLALAETFEHANRVINDNRAHVSVRVSASFKTGSFGIDINVVQGIVSQTLGFFGTDVRVAGTLNLLAILGLCYGTYKGARRGLVQLLRWLRGRKPTRIELGDEESGARVFVDEEYIDVEYRTIELLRSYEVRQSLERVVKAPLDREGIETVAFVYREEVTERITKQERAAFASPSTAERLEAGEQQFRATLQLVTVPMRDGYVWRVDDGNGAFTAEITDEAFLQRVRQNEVAFTPGDILVAEVRRRQYLEKGQVKTHNELARVLEHRSAYLQQIPLPIVSRNSSDDSSP